MGRETDNWLKFVIVFEEREHVGGGWVGEGTIHQ